MKKHILEIAVFLCGGIVMIFELVGSRVIGPYLGTSIFVWTSLIGIILGGLSLGYSLGGKLADRRPDQKLLAQIVFAASLSVIFVFFGKEPTLAMLTGISSSLRLNSVIAATILFLPSSVFLGMVSPFAAKLRMTDLGSSGATIGNLSALSTLGSIFGTFLSGFYLIPKFGTNQLLVVLAILLAAISALLLLSSGGSATKGKSVGVLIVIFAIPIATLPFVHGDKPGLLADTDTAYNRVWIYESTQRSTGKATRMLSINNENSSAMYLESDDLVHPYTKFYHLAKHFDPGFEKTVMFGGAGYSFPKDFLRKYPNASMEVVEIDPGITELAKKYFRLPENPKLTIRHEDGRVFLNRAEKGYDVIFGDAFSSQYSIPYQLTTAEAIQRKYDILNDGGIVILNVISAIDGRKWAFLRAEYATYSGIFPQTYVFPVNDPEDGEKVQNIMLVALKSKKKPDFTSLDPETAKMLKHLWTKPIATDTPALTDDYAPVDYLIEKAL